MAKLFF
ncbi:hypothetical protein YPPY58_0406, partial [Yersinia pestis PY-58]